jgi:hypothetical protein
MDTAAGRRLECCWKEKKKKKLLNVAADKGRLWRVWDGSGMRCRGVVCTEGRLRAASEPSRTEKHLVKDGE